MFEVTSYPLTIKLGSPAGSFFLRLFAPLSPLWVRLPSLLLIVLLKSASPGFVCVCPVPPIASCTLLLLQSAVPHATAV